MLSRNLKNPNSVVLVTVIALFVFVQSGYAFADLNSGVLNDYIGQPADQILSDFGDPLLRTPRKLWYRNDPQIVGGHPGAPNPAVVLGRNGVVVRGAGGDYPPLAMSRDFCDLVIKLDANDTIEAVENHGPGCFEYIHLLKTRQPTAP